MKQPTGQKEVKQDTTTVETAVKKEVKGEVERERYLISNSIRCIAADSDNVWIATDKGISRYDRKTNRWIDYSKENGLADDEVNYVAVDGDLVWCATNFGVSQYDVTKNQWRTFKRQDGLASERISCIAVDGNYVWFGTDSGLNRYDKTIDSWAVRTKKDGLISNNIKTVAVETEYVWVGTGADKRDRRDYYDRRRKPSRGGVSRYQRSTDSWNNYSKADGLIGEEITAIAVSEDTVWFGTYDSGVSRYSKTDQTFVETLTKTDLLVSDKISVIVVDGNNVWFATANGGVQRYLKTVNTWVRYTTDDGLASAHVTCLTTFGNEIWMGTYQSGVSKYDRASKKWTVYTKCNQLADDDVRSIAVDNTNQLWIGTAEGLSKYAAGKWSNYGKKDGLATNHINAVLVEDDQIWIGTNRGLGHAENSSESPQSRSWKFYNLGYITSLAPGSERSLSRSSPSRSDALWLGTNNGVIKFNKSTKKTENFAGKLPSELVTAIATTDTGNVWFGTQNGVFKFDTKSQEVTSYRTDKGLGDNYVNAILIGSERPPSRSDASSRSDAHNVWVGTRGGLSRYDEQNDVFTNVKDGLPSENVKALAKSGNTIWLGTPNGLASYHVNTGELKSFEDTSGYNINFISPLGGILWLGTTAGLVEFQPDKDSFEEHRARQARLPLREPEVSNIEFDGDYIWFSNWHDSPNGCIVRFNRRNETWKRYTRADIFKNTQQQSVTQVRYIGVEDDAVWFATDVGVLRYAKSPDTWQHYTTKDGLSSSDLSNITVSENSVWVSEVSGGSVNRFDKKTEKWSIHELPSPFPFDRISNIVVDDSDIWFGLRSGLHKLNEKTGEMKTYTTRDGLAGNGVGWISADENDIWVAAMRWGRGGSKALSRYNKTTGKWRAYSVTDVLMDNDLQKIVVGDDSVWILYDSWRDAGVTRYNKKRDEWTYIKPKGDWGSGVTEICEDGDYLWLATDENGLKRLHLVSGTWTSFDESNGLLYNRISRRALKVDDKYVWVGTRKGLSRYDKRSESWTSYRPLSTLNGKEVRAIAVDEQYVWCGSDEGISRYDKWYGEWANFRRRHRRRRGWGWGDSGREETVANNAISAIAVDEQYVWIGTRDGANRYDKIANRWVKYTPENGLPHPDITSVATDGNNIWMGTNAGIAKYPRTADDPNAWIGYTSGTEIQATAVSKEFAQTLVSDEVWCIAASKNAVWVGTRRGCSRYTPKNDLWTTFTEEDGLASNAVSCIAVDDNRIWFGGDKGITLYDDSTKDWVSFTVDDGLASNRITCISVNGQDVWFGTFDSGVMCYNKAKRTWKTYTKTDGLSHDSVLCIVADGENLWIGTHRGLNRYNNQTDTWTVYTEHYGAEDI